MLLRSSSTPILRSLLSSLTHSDPILESLEDGLYDNLDHSTSLSLSSTCYNHTSLASPAFHHFGGREEPLREVEQSVSVPLLRQFRRAQSENDLQTLDRGPTTPAKVAAISLLSNDGVFDMCEEGENAVRIRRTPSQRIHRRHSSMSAFPSVFFGTTGLDREDYIPEEVDFYPDEPFQIRHSKRIDVLESDDEIEQTRTMALESECRALKVRNGEVVVTDYSPQVEFRSASYEHVTSSSGRADDFVQLGDVENYFTSCVAANGATSVCNSGGYRPLSVRDKSSSHYLHGGPWVDVEDGSGGDGKRPATGPGTGGEGDDFGTGFNLTDLYYQRMLGENPGHPLLLRNYAQYLAVVKRDYFKAEKIYERAILANPGDGEILAQYAEITWNLHSDYERASSYFERAIQAAPDDSYVMAAYAAFLWGTEKEEDEQQAFQNVPRFHKSVVPAQA